MITTTTKPANGTANSATLSGVQDRQRVSDEGLQWTRDGEVWSALGMASLERLHNDSLVEIRNAAKLVAIVLLQSDAMREFHQQLRAMRARGEGHVSPLGVCVDLDRLYRTEFENGNPEADSLLKFSVAVRRVLGIVGPLPDDLHSILDHIKNLNSETLAAFDALVGHSPNRARVKSILYDRRRKRVEWQASQMVSRTAMEIFQRADAFVGASREARWMIAVGTATILILAILTLYLVFRSSRVMELHEIKQLDANSPRLLNWVGKGPIVVVVDSSLAGLESTLTTMILSELNPPPSDDKTTDKPAEGGAPAKPVAATQKSLLLFRNLPAFQMVPADSITEGANNLLSMMAAKNLLGGATEALVVSSPLSQGKKAVVEATLYVLPPATNVETDKPEPAWWNTAAASLVWKTQWVVSTPARVQSKTDSNCLAQLRRATAVSQRDSFFAAEAALRTLTNGSESNNAYLFAACVYLREARNGNIAARARAIGILREAYAVAHESRTTRLLLAVDVENRKPLIEQLHNEPIDGLESYMTSTPETEKQRATLVDAFVDGELAGKHPDFKPY